MSKPIVAFLLTADDNCFLQIITITELPVFLVFLTRRGENEGERQPTHAWRLWLLPLTSRIYFPFKIKPNFN